MVIDERHVRLSSLYNISNEAPLIFTFTSCVNTWKTHITNTQSMYDFPIHPIVYPLITQAHEKTSADRKQVESEDFGQNIRMLIRRRDMYYTIISLADKLS